MLYFLLTKNAIALILNITNTLGILNRISIVKHYFCRMFLNIIYYVCKSQFRIERHSTLPNFEFKDKEKL